MIEVDHLTKQYGSFTAVDDISFEVGKGEIVGFLGPNGAGKTTTMRVLTCFLPASEGTARIAGFDIFDEPLEVKKRIGYLPESPPLYRDMHVQTYLDFVASIKGVPKTGRTDRIVEVMGQCGLSDRAGQLIGQLSKGYRQRVGLAQAIVHKPDVIIMDEPTSGLDPNQIIEMRGLIRELAKERTVILSTHILPEVEMTCDRVIIINNGKIEAVDTPENLTANVRGTARFAVRVSGDVSKAVSGLATLPDIADVSSEIRDGETVVLVDCPTDRDWGPILSAKVVELGMGLLEMRREDLSLEEIFHALTTREEGV
ncbi:MAG: ATP-binding cassette domain-containing protein [Candidatus Latescibacteria bacterium]|nr:ATP-binding cassette domain-containing protein [Candidatus Latescibacterota bacterium]MBT4138595.1 ATP-binding cassette domain-containing protein [Candidatus Latescibacterota bacterium]